MGRSSMRSDPSHVAAPRAPARRRRTFKHAHPASSARAAVSTAVAPPAAATSGAAMRVSPRRPLT